MPRCCVTGTVLAAWGIAMAATAQDYVTCTSFAQVMAAETQVNVTRISDPEGQYTGFFFYQCLQFDPTDRYVLGMRVYIQNREVRPTDRADIGLIDLQDGCKWTKIGETTAWNWQQGARAQWRPASNEVVWNDRADDKSHYVCRVYDYKTGARRVLPRPIYALSPDGTTALTHDFERMKHGGTDYVGIADKYAAQFAPAGTGIWKMDMASGESQLLLSLARMAEIAYPTERPAAGCLYFFREGWNPSGTRFMAFVKEPKSGLDKAFTMTPAGADIRFFYNAPSHHCWRDDAHVLEGRNYQLYADDGTGKPEKRLCDAPHNGHVSDLPAPGGPWLLSDTYVIGGCQYLFLFHVPSKLYVPLAKLRSTAQGGIHRVDLHPRSSRNGRLVCIDATHEGRGRQMYLLDIGPILDRPPGR
ncbi:MAG TPA: hypothetical protein PLE19_15765 [Planctomycetota bacterium]|nr:hypothetical protein [Planctomycetota bacterium]HRR81338.1 hypothetical protein [Planctomycetota bacterium]HRT95352.1 hypothetical protein [Planctomycetota bacterium]